MPQTEIMDLTTVSTSFPHLLSPQIVRENILDAIDMTFAGEAQVLIVEGSEGIGKTTLLAQFAQRHSNRAISLFIKSASHWAYDPLILKRDLCNQLHWVLLQEELRPSEITSDDMLRDYITALQRRARLNDYYFVIDGLHEIPQENEPVREVILDMLPWSLSGFRFLFSGEANQIPKQRMQHVISKISQLPPFSFDETKRYFSDLNLDDYIIEKLHKSYRGFPSKLASARRILSSNAQKYLQDFPNIFPNPHEIEWREVDANNNQQVILLAIVAHEVRELTTTDLSRIMDITSEKVTELIQSLNFVLTDTQNDVVSFVSEEFRKFVSVQLRHLKDTVSEFVITDLLRDPEGDSALAYLPEHLEQAGKPKELIEYLSPERFTKIVERTQSLSIVRQKAALGVQASLELHRDDDLLRFSIQESMISELDKAEVWRSEVEARMALGDYTSALALAQRTAMKEDRLHLLAIIAKVKLEHNITPEIELKEQIRQLYNQIDPAKLGERAIDIAADLFYSFRDLAINLVEKSTTRNDDENALDWAFARLSIAASKVGDKRIQSNDMVEDIRSRIKDPKARSFSAAASLLLGEYSAKEIIAEVEKLDSAIVKMLLLRQWALDNKRRTDACDVIDFGLQLAIKTTKHAFNARDYREIASPLPFVSESSKAKSLVSVFDSQKSTIEHIGPTEDYIRLQLVLAHCESKFDFEAAGNRIIDVYLHIDDLKDLATKTNCMARLAALLVDIDPRRLLDRQDNLHTCVFDDLLTGTNLILETTGDHYQNTSGIIQSVAKTRRDLALDFATRLNTEDRRDKALFDIIKTSLRVSLNKIDLQFVDNLRDKLEDLDLKDEAILAVIERFFDEDENIDVFMPYILRFITHIDTIQNAIERCRAYCLAFSILVKRDHEKYASITSSILKNLDISWQAIDEGWLKVNNGFKIAESLATVSAETAQMYIDKTETARNEFKISDSGTAQTYLCCLLLAIRAYGGLLPYRVATQPDLERLTQLVDRLPSNGDRAALWADLALRCSISKKSDECRQIVAEHVRPLIDDISSDNPGRKTEVIVLTAPALYRAQPKAALELISKLPRQSKNSAYSHIVSFILQKISLSDPYDASRRQGYDIDYEDILEIFDLMDLMEIDATISNFVKLIVDSVISGKNKPGGMLTREQRNNLVYRLQEIVKNKLPSPRYIKHEGYRILTQAYILRLQTSHHQIQQKWLDLIDEARSIPNLNDKAYVLSNIATILPPEKFDRKQLIQEAKGISDNVPVLLERINLYHNLAKCVETIDKSLFRKYLELAMQLTHQKNDSNFYDVQKDIIDLAYQKDPTFAATLASSIDDDPVRKRLNQRIQLFKAKERMIDPRESDAEKDIPGHIYSQAAWMALTVLNTERVNTVKFEHTREFIRIASTLSMKESYPILAWVIENAVKRFATTEQARKYLRPVFDSILLGAELAGRMTVPFTIPSLQFQDRIITISNNKSLVLQSGDREKAVQFMKDWFEYQVQEYLKIQDPYFGLNDLEFLKLLISVNPNCEVYVLTGLANQEKSSKSLKEIYRDYWHQNISDQRPPDTEVVIVGNQQGRAPFHDRWLITKGGGLRLGTSLNSLGRKVSEISHMSSEEVLEREHILDKYLIYHKKDSDDGKLQYETFTL